MNMKNHSIASIAALMFTSLLLFCGCEEGTKTPVTPEEDTPTNFFIYEGYEFVINSVVRFDKGDNSVELWLSPVAGLSTIAEIESLGDYVVLCTHQSYLGSRDRFSGTTSKNSFIRFTDKEYAYGSKGTAYIEAAIDGQDITLSFLAENLYAKSAEPKPALAIEGAYSGPFTTDTEKELVNEWEYGKNRRPLYSATYYTREDGGDSAVTLYGENGKEQISIILTPDNIDKNFIFSASDKIKGVKLTYSGGADFDLTGAAGTIRTKLIDKKTIEAYINVSRGDITLQVQYQGEYNNKVIKTNRYIYDYEGSSSYEGNHEIVKLMVDTGTHYSSFYFSPAKGYNMQSANSTHMPILKIPNNIINVGMKKFVDLDDGWDFAFDLMQVWPDNGDEYKTHAADTDWIIVTHKDGIYEIEFVLNGVATGMPATKIDVHFKGKASE